MKKLFLGKAPPVASVQIASDAYIAVLGAHGGGPGGIVSVGTGAVGYALGADGSCRQTGGWGYPVDDKGSGAWIGLEAVSQGLKVVDGRALEPAGGEAFFHNLIRQIGATRGAVLDWLYDATATQIAALAPQVIVAAGQGHGGAIEVLRQAGEELEAMALALDRQRAIPMALVGGLAQPMSHYLPRGLTDWVRPAQDTPLAGALMMARGEAPPENLPEI